MFEFRVARPGERAVLCGSGTSRRDFLHVGALAAVGLSLPQYARAASEGKVRPGCEKRSCITIFNLGGPSNMDLWDMKPDAPAEIRGPFKPIRTKSDAFEVS
jgi:nucleoside-diphosphate-sugar epimerase